MTLTVVTRPRHTPVDQTQDSKALGYTDNRKIVRDRQGNLYIAYRKKYKIGANTDYHIFVAQSTNNGSTWTVLNHDQSVETVGNFNQRVPSIAIDAKDNLHLVWYGADAQNPGENQHQIKYVRSTDGGVTWSAWRNIVAVEGYQGQTLWQEHPTLQVGPDDQLYVVWEGRDQDYPETIQIKFAKSGDGGSTWSAWRNVAPATRDRSRPTLVATPGNQLYLLAYSSIKGVRQIIFTHSQDQGDTWAPWTHVARIEQDQRHVSVAVDGSGQVHAVWRQPPETIGVEDAGEGRKEPTAKPQVVYSSFSGAQWSQPVPIGANPAAAQFFPSITVDNVDRVWVVWSETGSEAEFPNEEPSDGAVYYALKTGQRWSSRLLLRQHNRDIYPSLRQSGFAEHKAVDIVWLDNSEDDRRIYHATLRGPTGVTWLNERAQIVTTSIAGLLASDSATSTFTEAQKGLRTILVRLVLLILIML
ncbi:MAG: glycoside hydrolase, partial [Chloroflexota bacterium]|nr:glycoside hydrolase [Chloroflexota bacterium]